MAAISATLVKDLREKTGAGMMDCKKALTEAGGDFEAAVDWLRAKGLSKAAKKADRIAADGLVGVKGDGLAAAVVEVNSETDFVARNDQFQDFVRKVAEAALAEKGDVEAVKSAQLPGGSKTVGETLTDLIATIGENMTIRRAAHVSVSQGAVANYIHSGVADGLGKIGVLVALEGAGEQGAVSELGRKIAMHVAATSPIATRIEDVDPEVVARERAVFVEQARESGKPDSIIEKMVEGRIRKFYEESVLLEQKFVMDPDKTVRQVIQETAKSLGGELELKEFVRFALGEGIEKGEEDFAAEVAKAAGGA